MSRYLMSISEKPAGKILYPLIVLLLVAGNVFVISRLINCKRSGGSTTAEGIVQTLQMGASIEQITIQSKNNEQSDIPSSDKPITLVFFSVSDNKALGYIGFLDVLMNSSVGDSLEIWVVDVFNGLSEYGEYLEDYDVNYTDDYEDIINEWEAYTVTNNDILIIQNSELMYFGRILKEHIFTHIYRLLNGDASTPPSISLSEPIFGFITNIGTNASTNIQSSPERTVYVLIPSYCQECGDDEYAQMILAATGVEPKILFPSSHPSIVLNAFNMQISHSMNVYSLDMNDSTISYDDFLRSYPVVLVTDNGSIMYVSEPGASQKTVVQNIVSLINRDHESTFEGRW